MIGEKDTDRNRKTVKERDRQLKRNRQTDRQTDKDYYL